MNSKQIGRDLIKQLADAGFVDQSLKVLNANKSLVRLKCEGGIPNLGFISVLLSYFDVSIDKISMEGDGEEFWLSDITYGGKDNWIIVTIDLT